MAEAPDQKAVEPFPLTVGWRDPSGQPWFLTTAWDVVGGRLECVQVTLESDASDSRPLPITASVWRSIPIGQVIEKARRDVISLIHGLAILTPEQISELKAGPTEKAKRYAEILEDLESEFPKLRAVAERLLPSATATNKAVADAPPKLREVARIYQEAWSEGRNPTQEVARAFGVSHTAAAKLVSRARDNRLLPRGGRGKPVGVEVEPANSRSEGAQE
jgi:hypothetical protein